MKVALAALALVLVAGAAEAQQRVQNPTAVLFTPSPDHANISAYQVEIRDAQGSVIQTIDIGKPVPDPATNECRATLNVQPIAFGVYTVTMRSVAGAVTGPASPPSETWERAPGPPSKGRVQ